MTVLRTGVYVYTPIVLIYLLVILLHWGLPNVPGALLFFLLVLVAIFIIFFAIVFLILGSRILYVVKFSISLASHSVIYKITLITMTCVGTLLGYLALAIIRIGSGENPTMSFSQNLAVIVLGDIFFVIVTYGVMLAFGLHSFREIHTSSNGATLPSVQMTRATSVEALKRDPENGRSQTDVSVDDLDSKAKPDDLTPMPSMY